MAIILSTPTELTVQDTRPSRPLLSALTRLWVARSTAAPAVDADVGYESAQPWTLREHAANGGADSTY